MKEKTKKILSIIFDIIGYGGGIGTSIFVTDKLIGIYKHGEAVIREPNIYVLLTEIGFAGGTTLFLIYKLIEAMIRRGKKYRKKEESYTK